MFRCLNYNKEIKLIFRRVSTRVVVLRDVDRRMQSLGEGFNVMPHGGGMQPPKTPRGKVGGVLSLQSKLRSLISKMLMVSMTRSRETKCLPSP